MTILERSARRCRTRRLRVRNRPLHISNTNGGLFLSSGLSFKKEGTGAMNARPPSNSRTSPKKTRQSKNSIMASLCPTPAPSVKLFSFSMSYRNRTTKGRNHTRTYFLSIPHSSILSRHCQHFPPMACSMVPLILIFTSNKRFKA